MTPPADQSPTVFVVDDDEAVRHSLTAMIESLGLGVECFASADEFLTHCDLTRPGCLLLDVRMSGMSGIELQEKLKRDGNDIPVIIITGHGDVPMKERAIEQGAVEFLEKPCRPKELAAAIRKALKLGD